LLGGVVQAVITNLRIEDFQSIESLDVECGPITVFTGETDVGKSAIVRAIYGLAFNDYPRGHVRDGAKHSLIEVQLQGEKVNDGYAYVKASKGDGVNKYFLDLTGRTMEFGRVGVNVPEEVSEILGWRMLEVDDGTKFTPNFSRQFDPPFLITETPSRKAKLLGSLTNIATLYAAMKEGLSRERANKAALKTWGEVHDKALDDMAHQEQVVDGAIVRTSFVSDLLSVIHGLRDELATLQVALEKVTVGKAQVEQSQRRLTKREAGVIDLSGVGEMMDEWIKLRRRVRTIVAMKEAVEGHKGRVESAEWDLMNTQAEVVAFRDEHPMCPMCGKDWHR